MHDSDPSVVLVSMPWTSLIEPSCGLGLLKGVLDERGVTSRVLHLNVFLLEHLRVLTYKEIADVYALNDFLFTGVLDGAPTHAQLRVLRGKVRELLNRGRIESRRVGGPEGLVSALMCLRNETIPAWLDTWADEIAATQATLVGFTCMYDQTIASLALAKLLRDRMPDVTIALGGYAVRAPAAEMLVASTPWIDAVCTGEGETTICELYEASVGERSLGDVRGIARREPTGAVTTTEPAPQTDLNTLPVPNYDDFFDDIERLSLEHLVDVKPHVLPIENSRGCWWGAKSHCVFCGIRDSDLVYRARDAEQTIAAMETLHARHGIDFFRFSDYILPTQYFDTLLPELRRRGAPFRLSGEIKANQSNESFALMAAAGFEEVQPGIESFSTPVLRSMRKGVSALQNIYTLLLGRRHRVHVYYNLIYGFPADVVEDYEEMVALLPRLLHLDAPVTCLPAQITRYAPLQANPEQFGIAAGGAEASYELVFSDEYRRDRRFDVDAFCYYFERMHSNSSPLERQYRKIHEVVDVWRVLAASETAWLYEDVDVQTEGMVVRDRRGGDDVLHELSRDEARVLRACHEPTPTERLGDAKALAALDERGLIVREGRRALSLLAVAPEQYAASALEERQKHDEPVVGC